MVRRLIVLGPLVLALAGCGAPSEADIQAAISQTQAAFSPTPATTDTPEPTRTPKPTKTAKPTETPKPTKTPKPTRTPNPGGKWTIDEETSSIDDSKTVLVRLVAENEISNDFQDIKPTLILRCEEGAVDAYIFFGMQMDFDRGGNINRTTITVRHDKDEAYDIAMEQSTDNEALFFPDPLGAINEMVAANTLIVRAPPFSAPPQEVEFDTRRLEYIIDPLIDACNVPRSE